MPFTYTSPNAIPPAQTLVAFMISVVAGARRLTQTEQRKAGFKRPATLRAAVFIGGAVLGTRSRMPVLYIAQSWGGLDKHKPLLDNILQWPGATSPKLPPEPPGNGMTGGITSAPARRSLTGRVLV